MSKLNDDEIRRLARLAKIGLSDGEVSSLVKDLGEIVGFVEQLQSVDTAGVEPVSQVTGLEDVWREDEVKPSPVPPTELLANAPEQQDGYVKVRRVL